MLRIQAPSQLPSDFLLILLSKGRSAVVPLARERAGQVQICL